ncbi:hypothetical protein M501DRAFT_961438 [Patellaria atrata CBS 101060]|uniref:U3 small nucleolar RNA-associated protein 6 N-terminal domain-containing protein n=1 Tax=Patellaria atrata CBS 101060 TaxID=1346257 RepID=A0A9P4S603_9PEZI|nr:hypothetical protein M501DRAFT_961438 [Patellaria atrata CBS 101060]
MTSDKARFYLESSIPELLELERKEIFTKEEIKAITKKRSDFEHIVNARGSHPSDWARYAAYEINLENLRKKRVKRLGIKGTTHSGQRRIFFILDRGTKKFHGDVALWMQYLNFARGEKAHRKVNQILTDVLRMHPTRPELWIYAARYAMDEADMTNARSYMQRGLRFRKSAKELWMEYAKLEMLYIGKIAARRTILGLDVGKSSNIQGEVEDDPDADVIALPKVTAEDIDPTLNPDITSDDTALKNLTSTLILTGAIPMAIFDQAMKQFNHSPTMAEQFFTLFAEFDRVPCVSSLLNRVVEALERESSSTVQFPACYARTPIVGVQVDSVEFPTALGQSLERVKSSMQQRPHQKADLAERAMTWLLPLARRDKLDPSLHVVISASLRQFLRPLNSVDGDSSGKLADFITRLLDASQFEDAKYLLTLGLKRNGSDERLLAIEASLPSR